MTTSRGHWLRSTARFSSLAVLLALGASLSAGRETDQNEANITVPAGDVFGLPVGMSFMGRAWSESRLVALPYAYEQATRHRRPPRFSVTVDLTQD